MRVDIQRPVLAGRRTIERLPAFPRLATMIRRTTALAAIVVVTGCAALPAGHLRTESRAWPNPEATSLGRTFVVQADAQATPSGVRLLWNGADAFAARAALADHAERTLDLQYYMLRSDDSTIALLSRVAAAADRGVRVRLLVDDIHAVGRDVALGAYASHPNIEVRVFNPFLWRGPLGISRVVELIGNPARLNHRMHNKMWIADNAAAVVGGRNLGNEYFALESPVDFVDLDVLLAGPVVQQTSASFDDYWASDWTIPIEAFVAPNDGSDAANRALAALGDAERRLRDSPYAGRLRTAPIVGELARGDVPLVRADAIALYDPPGKVQGRDATASAIRTRLRPLLEQATVEVFLVSPYFVPGDAGVDALRRLRDRGVPVKVLTNSLAGSDVTIVYAGYSRYQLALVEAGVELYELRPIGGSDDDQEHIAEALGAERSTLHAKTFVVDRRYVFVGSMNLDPRSDLINTECGVLLDSRELAEMLLADLDRLTAPDRSHRLVAEDGQLAWTRAHEGRAVVSRTPPEASAWRRWLAGVMRVFAPEHLL